MAKICKLHILGAVMFCLGAVMVNTATAVTEWTTSFEDSSMSPFSLDNCCGNYVVYMDWGSGAKQGSKVAKFQWWEDNYNGERSGRGIEAQSRTNGLKIKEEGWYGFSFRIPTGSETFPLDTSIGVAQALANGGDDCPVSWTWILNTDPNGLILQHRVGMGSWTETVISPTIPTGQWIDLIFHMVYSNNYTGQIEVWYGDDCLGTKGTPTYSVYDTRLGCDCWDGDSLLTGTHVKFGMYCHDVDDYVDGEKRTIYFDQVSAIDGDTDFAWYTVNPNHVYNPDSPQAPSNLNSIESDGRVVLTWDGNSESDVAGYNIYRSTTSGSGYTKINSSLVTNLFYIDNDVVNGTVYYYVATAMNTSNNESAYSDEVAGSPGYPVCGDASTVYLSADLNKDCIVDFADFAKLASEWLYRGM